MQRECRMGNKVCTVNFVILKLSGYKKQTTYKLGGQGENRVYMQYKFNVYSIECYMVYVNFK